jgi:hypothetical protein
VSLASLEAENGSPALVSLASLKAENGSPALVSLASLKAENGSLALMSSSVAGFLKSESWGHVVARGVDTRNRPCCPVRPCTIVVDTMNDHSIPFSGESQTTLLITARRG